MIMWACGGGDGHDFSGEGEEFGNFVFAVHYASGFGWSMSKIFSPFWST